MPKPITIIGGGLAGLTLGIGLRRHGLPVTVLEAGHYPRHRVCGEFISGRGQQTLANLGLLEPLFQAGARLAATAAFFLPRRENAPVRRLESEALCISRYELDSLLARMLREAGGDLREDARGRVDHLKEGTVRTTGRRPHPVEDGASWFGLKIHARKLPLVADLEMHAFNHGYVGLCRLPNDEVNVCGLFRRSRRGKDASLLAPPKLPDEGGSAIPFPIPTSSSLSARLSAAELDKSSFCSVAGLSLKPQRAAALPDCSLGDALTMTPPVTGNGMSMAFESAELAIEPLCAYARGQISWPDATRQVAHACDARFASRLRWAKWLQWMMFSPLFQNHLGPLALRSQFVWNTFFRRTRSPLMAAGYGLPTAD